MSSTPIAIATLLLAGAWLLPQDRQEPAAEPPRQEAEKEEGKGEKKAGDGEERAPTGTTASIADIPIEELSGADREAAEALLHARLEEQYFLTCDGNGNGWVSFREARARLKIDRSEYALFDADRDGRVDRVEFGKRYQFTIENVGAFRPPTAPKRFGATQEGSPLSFDFNGTGALEVAEVSAFLAASAIPIPADGLMGYLDADESGALEEGEIAEVLDVVAPFLPDTAPLTAEATPPPTTAPDPEPEVEPVEPPKTVEELFGATVEREVRFGTTPLPPRIVGPVPHFYRLDKDEDGYISSADLMDLLSPASVGVRAGAVIASVDRDGDGRLDPAEFKAALQKPKQD